MAPLGTHSVESTKSPTQHTGRHAGQRGGDACYCVLLQLLGLWLSASSAAAATSAGAARAGIPTGGSRRRYAWRQAAAVVTIYPPSTPLAPLQALTMRSHSHTRRRSSAGIDAIQRFIGTSRPLCNTFPCSQPMPSEQCVANVVRVIHGGRVEANEQLGSIDPHSCAWSSPWLPKTIARAASCSTRATPSSRRACA